MGCSEYVGAAFVTDLDGDEVEVSAALRAHGDEWGGTLTGPPDWIRIAGSTEPFFELRVLDGPSAAAFISAFDEAATAQRVTISGLGPAPFR